MENASTSSVTVMQASLGELATAPLTTPLASTQPNKMAQSSARGWGRVCAASASVRTTPSTSENIAKIVW